MDGELEIGRWKGVWCGVRRSGSVGMEEQGI
jgi:hypothetical protein